MKKFIASFLSILMILGITNIFTVFAVPVQDGYEYYINDEGSAVITDYTGDETELIIPSEFEGYPLKRIGDACFFDNEYITKVIIPEGVEEIAGRAFYLCHNLTEIEIPETVKDIGGSCFFRCEKLESVDLPENLERLGPSVFSGCFALKSIEIPNSMTYIQMSTFNGAGIEEYVLPDSITGIAAYAFSEPLKTITIPSSVTDIHKDAFVSTDEDFSKMTIKGYTGSVAETYAKEKGMNFVSIGKVFNNNVSVLTSKLEAGEKVKLFEIVNPKGEKVTYTAKTPDIASVNKKGVVTGLQKGKADFVITVGEEEFNCRVKVTSDPKLMRNNKKVTSVKLNRKRTVKLQLTGKVKNIKNVYTNTKIAKITSGKNATTIKVKGLKNGTTTLKIRVNGVKTIKLKVTVK